VNASASLHFNENIVFDFIEQIEFSCAFEFAEKTGKRGESNGKSDTDSVHETSILCREKYFFEDRNQKGDGGGNEQDTDRRVFKFFAEQFPSRFSFRRCERVCPVLLPGLFDLFVGKSLRDVDGR
jgi:hypothetical protein